MKTIAALIAGLLLSIATFCGGLMTSMIYLDGGKVEQRAEGLDTAALWTSEPVKVDKRNQSFTRLAARPVPEEPKVAGLNKSEVDGMPKKSTVRNTEAVADDPQMLVDPMTTGAIDPVQAETDRKPQAQQTIAHLEWCSRHYRSYRADNNTYKPYGGRRRACESPYSGTDTASRTEDSSDAEKPGAMDNADAYAGKAKLEQASFDNEEGDYLTDDHVQSCLQRYNSYRPGDNSYQSYNGGPRRQCQ